MCKQGKSKDIIKPTTSWMEMEASRRLEITRIIHAIWTQNGSDESGLAGPLLMDGRVDALALYMTDLAADSVSECAQSSAEVDKGFCEEFAYDKFVQDYMIPNRPLVIDGIADHWRARNEWTQIDAVSGKAIPNVQAMCKDFGDDQVSIHIQSQRGFTIARPSKKDEILWDYYAWWNEYHQRKQQQVQNDDDEDHPIHYMKDYKFVACHPSYHAYEWPLYFRDDWLNGAMGNAYKFVYLGPAGSSTRLHADVLRSFSWSTNVCGRKRWFLVPPWCTPFLYDCFGKTLAPHLHIDVQEGLDFLYPGLEVARKHSIEVDQSAGSTIFVPSGWYHTVENLEPTLSINHNWLNGANIHWSWKKLKRELETSYNNSIQGGNSDGAVQSQSQQGTDQVGDDLLLLWVVLSKKAKSVLLSDSFSLFEHEKKKAKFDLNAALPILIEIRDVIQARKDHGLVERSQCDIDDLIHDIQEYLQDLSK